NGMAINAGGKTHAAPRTRIAKRPYGQAHAPVAAADANVDDVAPAPFRVGLANELVHALAFSSHRFHRRGGAQHGVPGGAVLRIVDRLTREQPVTKKVEVACL